MKEKTMFTKLKKKVGSRRGPRVSRSNSEGFIHHVKESQLYPSSLEVPDLSFMGQLS